MYYVRDSKKILSRKNKKTLLMTEIPISLKNRKDGLHYTVYDWCKHNNISYRKIYVKYNKRPNTYDYVVVWKGEKRLLVRPAIEFETVDQAMTFKLRWL